MANSAPPGEAKDVEMASQKTKEASEEKKDTMEATGKTEATDTKRGPYSPASQLSTLSSISTDSEEDIGGRCEKSASPDDKQQKPQAKAAIYSPSHPSGDCERDKRGETPARESRYDTAVRYNQEEREQLRVQQREARETLQRYTERAVARENRYNRIPREIIHAAPEPRSPRTEETDDILEAEAWQRRRTNVRQAEVHAKQIIDFLTDHGLAQAAAIADAFNKMRHPVTELPIHMHQNAVILRKATVRAAHPQMPERSHCHPNMEIFRSSARTLKSAEQQLLKNANLNEMASTTLQAIQRTLEKIASVSDAAEVAEIVETKGRNYQEQRQGATSSPQSQCLVVRHETVV